MAATGHGFRPSSGHHLQQHILVRELDQPVPHSVVQFALALRLREPRSLRELDSRPPSRAQLPSALRWLRGDRFAAAALGSTVDELKPDRRTTFQSRHVRGAVARTVRFCTENCLVRFCTENSKGRCFVTALAVRPTLGCFRAGWHRCARGGFTMPAILSDLLLFSCVTAFITGFVIAAASLLG